MASEVVRRWFETIDTEWVDATYSYYNDAERNYVFMDTETFEEIELSSSVVGKAGEWLGDGQLVDVESFDGKWLTFRFKGEITAEVTGVEERGRNDGQNMITTANGITQAGPGYIKVGDTVLLPEYGASMVKLGDDEFHLVKDMDILGKFEG